MALERKAAKPNADFIARTKKIWERLRIKSAVPKEERTALVEELFSIISGRVKEFVFKHDSVRVIQCALKYGTPEQKKTIAQELRGNYRELAESKYAKFLIAKMVTGNTDGTIRDMVVPEFYGHVKRLMRHPEASWIVDDIYRGLATKQQKARLLREWYGAEFVLDTVGKAKSKARIQSEKEEDVTSELSEILKQSPEKRGPIMQHLKEMTNQLVQKKTTGFTMLHDALLQYFLNTKPDTTEASEFLDMLKDDEEGDLFKNLAFTKSGARLVCLALAYGNSKDRRTILKFFKTHIKLLSGDEHGHTVLLTAYEVIDDTVMTGKAIFPELLSKDMSQEEREQELAGQTTHLTARIPLLYLLSPEPPKWLLSEEDSSILKEIKEIRATTSKKESETRRIELLKQISQPLLDLIAARASILIETSFGCQFLTEALLGAIGNKQPALEALAQVASSTSPETQLLLSTSHTGRMFKTLVQGGRFDQSTKSIIPVDPPLKFHDLLYQNLTSVSEDTVVQWATGSNAFTILAMLESPDFTYKAELEILLKNNKGKLESTDSEDKAARAGSKIIREKIGGASGAPSSVPTLSADKKNKGDKKSKSKK